MSASFTIKHFSLGVDARRELGTALLRKNRSIGGCSRIGQNGEDGTTNAESALSVETVNNIPGKCLYFRTDKFQIGLVDRRRAGRDNRRITETR